MQYTSVSYLPSMARQSYAEMPIILNISEDGFMTQITGHVPPISSPFKWFIKAVLKMYRERSTRLYARE